MTEMLPVVARDAQLERSILGSALIDPDVFTTIVERLDDDDFTEHAYRLVFTGMRQLDGEHRGIDYQNLWELLQDRDAIKSNGGVAFISKLADGVQRKAPIAEWCETLKSLTQLRRLQRFGSDLTEQLPAVETGSDGRRGIRARLAKLIEQADGKFSEIREDFSDSARGAQHVGEICVELTPVFEMLSTGKGQMLGRPTGFKELDRVTNGFCSGDLWLLAGRPSGGKTSLGIEFILREAKLGSPAAMFSLEMSRASVLLRMICREANVSYHYLTSGQLSPGHWLRVSQAIAAVSNLPIWIDDRPVTWAHEIRWRIRSLAKRSDSKLVVLDYLQLLRAKAENRTQEVTKISMELKAAARELGDAVGGTLVALSQLNRLAADEKPQLHHLRESGQLEQDADCILLLRDEEKKDDWASPNGNRGPSIKILQVAKQRNGPLEEIRLEFLPVVMGFSEAEVRQHAG